MTQPAPVFQSASCSLIDFSLTNTFPDAFNESCEWFEVDNLPKMAFDHDRIIETGLEYLRMNINTEVAASNLLPEKFTSAESIFTPKIFGFMLFGGLLVGFGARYAGGCTSGHAITGMSNLQLPSLIAVIGFFVGGLIASHFLLPLIF